MAEKFDVIVVGAGMAGNAAAYTLAKAGVNVLQIERGEYAGSKNVQGGILYAQAVEALIPEFRESAPLERHIIEQRIWVLNDKSYIGTHFRSDNFNEERPNRYTLVRAQFDKWLNGEVKKAGATVITETTVLELLKDETGKVNGVRCDRENGEVRADCVILCDGVNALVGSRSGVRKEINSKEVALAVKEMHFLPRDVINERFNIQESEGVVIEILGTVTEGMLGTGFIYTNGESLSVGIGVIVSDLMKNRINPSTLLEKMKSHPSVAPLLKGSEVKEYSAHLLPEGGYDSVPELSGNGWMVCGDSAHLLNAIHREGSNMALTSGRLAAETYLELRDKGQPINAENLKKYNQKLENSFVLKDLKKYRRMPHIMLENKQFVTMYPDLLAGAAETLLRVDGVDKKTKEKKITKDFRSARGIFGLVGDAFKLVRAWR
ncbi:FAD-dependent oxidoreductase [Phaeovibrio sulfidiphilus]|uniref:Protein FixC n=1 Tax=Phaeovibrio sulfidiphilus TaxID=1220600 RepID=A0A8J6YPC5_9PROT|nr:FAD-dependent oxidoreductase [Phaeovibrio sulfidiphilus]MBE1237106.1 FAD-dependent oxidoreductase [Phaeovibrio sulfidiphilus]